MSQYIFGSGEVFILPPATSADQTPMRCATIQDFQCDIATSIKTLYGNRQFPEAAANAEGKITGKLKLGRLDARFLSSVLPGAVKSVGMPAEVTEIGLIASGAYTVLGASGLVDDLGVYASDGTPYSKIVPAAFTGAISTTVLTVSAITAGNLTPGQIVTGAGVTANTVLGSQLTGTTGGVGTYAVSISQTVASEAMTTTAGLVQYSGPASGVYSFATGSNGLSLSFKYSKTQTTGNTTAVGNNLMGIATTFFVDAFNPNAGKPFGIKIYAAVFSKISLPEKNTDFLMMDVEFEGTDNGSGKVYDLYSND